MGTSGRVRVFLHIGSLVTLIAMHDSMTKDVEKVPEEEGKLVFPLPFDLHMLLLALAPGHVFLHAQLLLSMII